MRDYKYLSPSALSKWESARETFYLHYLCETRNPKPPQELHMAAGSAVDAFIKSGIHSAVHGETATKGSQFEFETIFEKQVEKHIRDEALVLGRHLFDEYNLSGAYGSLLADIVKSPYPPEMEFEIKGTVEGVPLLGKPDLRYFTQGGIHIIADFKVNGSASKVGASPQQGYKMVRDYGSRTNGQAHKKYEPFVFGDVEINARYLNEFCDYWADQLAIYSWLLGEKVGSEDYVIRMEQFACRPVKSQPLPRSKCATHMARIENGYQLQLMQRVRDCWNAIEADHIFTDLPVEESRKRCELLDMQAQTPMELHPALANYAHETFRFG